MNLADKYIWFYSFVKNPYSPVETEPDPDMCCLNWQGIPLDRKFFPLFDGIPCHFVSVGQISQIMEM